MADVVIYTHENTELMYKNPTYANSNVKILWGKLTIFLKSVNDERSSDTNTTRDSLQLSV